MSFPFAVYSHGNGGEGLLAYPYGELMASHGWIVVGPNHTGNTAFDFLETPDPGTRSALDRPNDITAVIDEFEAGLSGDELAGKADTSGVFVFGHSFGGYTTFTSGGADVDFDAANAGLRGLDERELRGARPTPTSKRPTAQASATRVWSRSRPKRPRSSRSPRASSPTWASPRC